jgi:hypothetical protein
VPFRGQPCEAVRVDVVAVDREPVPGRVELHDSCLPALIRQRLTQP